MWRSLWAEYWVLSSPGYAAHLHGNGYEKVSGVPIRLKTVCDLNLDLANQVKERYGYEQAITNFDDMLADPGPCQNSYFSSHTWKI